MAVGCRLLLDLQCCGCCGSGLFVVFWCGLRCFEAQVCVVCYFAVVCAVVIVSRFWLGCSLVWDWCLCCGRCGFVVCVGGFGLVIIVNLCEFGGFIWFNIIELFAG